MYLRLPVIFGLIFISGLCTSQTGWCDMETQLTVNRQNGKLDKYLELVHEQENKQQVRNRSILWYQVVVHIVRTEFDAPVSKALVLQQIDVLNNDFAGRGENIINLPEEFSHLIADTELKFCLASLDPAGQPTDGITHTLTNVRDIALQTGPGGRKSIHYDQLGGQTGWDPSRYINIWVGEFGSFLGSSFLPGMAPFAEEIGVVVNIRAFGSLGDASKNGFYGGGHTLAHEMGHYFGLLHIWGNDDNDCNDSDGIADTPNAAGPYFNCPSGTQMSCGTSNMYQNFMDLTDDRCLSAFTGGQSDRMHAAIEIYYANLDLEGPCHSVIEPFDHWYDELIWAYDAASRQYVLYHPDGYSGNIEVEVFSVDGRFVMQGEWNGDQSYLLDLNSNANGIFVVRISDGDHEKIRKVVSY